MAVLQGHPSQAPVYVPVAASSPAGAISVGGPTTSPRTMQAGAMVVDGTPVRVVVYALAAGATLFILRMAGFKFNVGVSG